MLELIILSLAVVASIGPTNLFAIKEGAKNGAINTFYVISGGILVDLFYANLAGLGLSALGKNPYFKTVLLSIGAFMFFYLGIKGIITAFQKEMVQAAESKLKIHPILIGIAMTLPNPFTIIFWTTAIAGLSIGYQPGTLMAVILGVGITWAALEALLIHFARKLINDKILRGVEFVASLIILAFAFKFLLQIVNIAL